MIKVEEIRRNIMLFGMFKNNKNKIKECYMTNRDKFHSNFSLNEKIKTEYRFSNRIPLCFYKTQ